MITQVDSDAALREASECSIKAPLQTAPPVSVVILTLDEEHNLPACLDSLWDLDDIHILDSGSRDRSVEIARDRGVPVHFNRFESFGQQRNWAIDHIHTKYAWQLHLDADERLTPEFIAELGKVLRENPSVGGYFVPSKLMFADRWLKYAGQYPVYQARLFHRDRLRFIDHGHGQRESTDFPLQEFKQPYLHFAFSKGLDHWFCKHAGYARLEAEQALGLESNAGGFAALLSNPIARRRLLKRLSYKIPARYWMRLLYMLFIKRSFLDGRAGITYSQMLATYEAMVAVNLKLLRHDMRLSTSSTNAPAIK